eukprot:1105708_1
MTSSNQDDSQYSIPNPLTSSSGATLDHFLAKNPKLPLKLKLNCDSDSDVTELVRSSCQRLTQSCKYMDINYHILSDYFKTNGLNWQGMDEYQTNCNKSELNFEEFTERDIINLSCFSVLLAIGSQNDQSDILKIAVHNMFRKYPKLDTASLNGITVDEVAAFFEGKLQRSVCEMIRQYIQEIVRVLLIKRLRDFTDYVYNIIDMAWIKSQTKNLSAIETIQWELNDKHQLGLTLAPTQKDIVRRCVVVDYEATDDDPKNLQNNAICARLVEQQAFLYAINDDVVYNHPFDDIIAKISHVLTATKAGADHDPLCPFQRNGVVALQFGLHLENPPTVTQSLLFNLVNDFSPFNDQYLYKNMFGVDRNLRVYLYQRAQAVVLELYYNLYVNASKEQQNVIFNFSDIDRLTAVLDNIIPFVLLSEGLIQMNEEFKDEIDEPREADILVEMQVCSLWAIELLVEEGSKHSVNAAEIAYYFRSQATKKSTLKHEK